MRSFVCNNCGETFSPPYRIPRKKVLNYCSKQCAGAYRNGEPKSAYHRASDLRKAIRNLIQEEGRYVPLREVVDVLKISSKTLTKHNVSVLNENRSFGFRPNKRHFEDSVGKVLGEIFGLEREVSFDWCKSPKGYPLTFDFQISGSKVLIEADGYQHKKGHPWHTDYTAQCDGIKDVETQRNGFVLVRIPYTRRVTRKYVMKQFAATLGATAWPVMASANA